MLVRNRFYRIVIPTTLACLLLAALSLSFASVRAAQLGPQATHCGGGGDGKVDPLVGPDYCGCTWGEVRFRDQALAGAVVTLTFQGQSLSTTTRLDASSHNVPFFDMSGNSLGARAGDLMTLTVRFGDQTVSRLFRGWPDAEGKQRIDLVFPERGQWQPWLDGGYTRSLAIQGETLWAGGRAGLISASLTTGISLTHTLPWTDQAVTALAVGPAGHVWAVGGGGVAEFDRTAWQTHAAPFSGTLRAVAIEPDSGAAWVGGQADGTGRIARYSGGWQTPVDFTAPVMALAVDGDGRLWAGTWDQGLYRQDGGGGWTQYQVVEGLALHRILSLAAAGRTVWAGTAPYVSGQNQSGVAQYNLDTAAWQSYTTAHGLPEDTVVETAASIYDIDLNETGQPWLGGPEGVYFLVEGERWWGGYTTTHGLRSEEVTAIAATSDTVVAATAAGLDRLDPQTAPGNPPLAAILSITPTPTVTTDLNLTLTGSGADQDESQTRIVGWDWHSNLDGPLCAASQCVLSASLLSGGTHTLSLRAQDDEGDWSAPVTATLRVIETGQQLYLPVTLKNQP